MKDEVKKILELKNDSDYIKLNINEIIILKYYIITLEKKINKISDYCLKSSLILKSHFFSDIQNILTGGDK